MHALQPPADTVTVVETEGFDLRYDLDSLEGLIREHHPALVVLDSFRALWTGDENDTGDVTQALAPLQALLRQCGVGGLLLHHVGKRQQSNYRGSSAIAANCELIYRLGRAGGDADRERRYLVCVKSRPAPEPPIRWLRLSVEEGRVLLSETSAPDDGGAGPGRPSTAERYVPVILAKLRAEGPQKQADLARAIGQKPSSGTIRRLLDALKDNGLAAREPSGGRWFALAGPPPSPGDGNSGNGKAGQTIGAVVSALDSTREPE